MCAADGGRELVREAGVGTAFYFNPPSRCGAPDEVSASLRDAGASPPQNFRFESKDRGAAEPPLPYVAPMTRTLERPRRAKEAVGDDARWAAVLARDASFDGTFYFSVATTGVYCRPSCAARRPKRENVRFHATCADAEAAGFRPCKRCSPDAPGLRQEHAAKVAQACRLIEDSDGGTKLEDLADAVGLSPYHFHRIFKAVAGLTPKAYAMAHRHKRVRAELKGSNSVIEAIYDAGFNSSGRFYASASQVLGMTPGDFRSGGANAEIRYAVGTCSLGRILVAASRKGVAAILMGDDAAALVRDLKERFPRAELIGGDAGFERLVARVVAFVEAPGASLELPLDVRGTAFQHRVWTALRDIAPGSTASYAEIARRIGAPKAVRAVAGACAANPLAVAIPCHRAVRSDGALAGYRWGVARKRALLAREAK
jgi:AraC family transcriptional regulator of adaptative response/methylated-DNA-[protein]-cysteine methyltransferase